MRRNEYNSLLLRHLPLHLSAKNVLRNVVLPADAQSFRYGEAGSIVRDGYLPEYKKIPLIELGNCLVPNTINGTPEVVLDDDIIYMINRCA